MVDKSRSRVKGSVGLGLALCQKIADIHGFQLEITSHLGKWNDHICFMVNNLNLQNSYNLRKIWCNERCYTCGHKQEGEFIQHEKKHK